MKLDKKEITIIILSFGVITSAIINFTFTIISGRSGIHIPIGENEVFRVGTLHGPNDLDPVDCWDKWSVDVLIQVVEGFPLHMFLDLYSNTSIWNVGMVNNHLLEEMITNAMNELNDTKRWELYQNTSHYISNELFLHVFGFHSKQFFVHTADLYNVPYDSIGNFHAYSIKRNLTWSPY